MERDTFPGTPACVKLKPTTRRVAVSTLSGTARARQSKTKPEALQGEWQNIGTVSVDGGMVMIVDPCYLYEARTRNEIVKDIKNYIRDARNSLGQQLGRLTVISGTGWGDGGYPVYALMRTIKGEGYPRVAALYIPFM